MTREARFDRDCGCKWERGRTRFLTDLCRSRQRHSPSRPGENCALTPSAHVRPESVRTTTSERAHSGPLPRDEGGFVDVRHRRDAAEGLARGARHLRSVEGRLAASSLGDPLVQPPRSGTTDEVVRVLARFLVVVQQASARPIPYSLVASLP
jgi:hypothetical protein